MRYWKFAAVAAAILLVQAGAAQALSLSLSLGNKHDRIDGKPNLNGVWQAMNTANWDLAPHDARIAPAAPETLGAIGAIPAGLGVVQGGTIPYLPEALKRRDENRKNAPKADPEAACYLPGIPRATYLSHPFQIVQSGGDDILMAYEYDAANRVIHMRDVEVPPIDTWMGTSYGSWEGDTLKVVTLAQNGMTWLDRAGDYMSATATVTERFTLQDRDHILYEATIDDPETFSRPWKISMPLYRRIEPNAQLLDFRCVPFADLLVYGDLVQTKDANK